MGKPATRLMWDTEGPHELKHLANKVYDWYSGVVASPRVRIAAAHSDFPPKAFPWCLFDKFPEDRAQIPKFRGY